MRNQNGGIKIQMAVGSKNKKWHEEDRERKSYRKPRLK